MAVLPVLASRGCSKADEETRANSNDATQSSRDGDASARDTKPPEPQVQHTPENATVDDTPTSLPALHVDPDASTVDEEYPHLASGALGRAKLVELPDGVLLRAGDVLITQKDIDAEVAESPAELREQLRKNAFFLVEQTATQKLLVREAR